MYSTVKQLVRNRWVFGALRVVLPALFGISVLGFSSSGAEESQGSLGPLKAAFIFNFLQFVEFNAPSGTKWAVCLRNVATDVSPAFHALDGRVVHDRLIEVHEDPKNPAVCHVMYSGVADSGPVNFPGVLTVGDRASFLDDGGIIQFRVINNKLRFAVNLLPARATGIELRAKLLALAEEVRK